MNKMLIEINTDNLLSTGLTANQFLLAQLIYERKLATIAKLKLEFGNIVDKDFDILISAGYLRKSGDTYFVEPKFINEVRKEGMFEELLAIFPTSVIRPDGTKDYLRVGLSNCKTKYNNIVRKSRIRHDKIMKCLELEVSTRTKQNNLAYMKRLNNWLTSKEWEAWEPRLEDSAEELNNSTDYGQELE